MTHTTAQPPSFLPTLLICLLPNIGVHRYWALVDHCGSADNVLTSDPDALPIINSSAKALLHNYQASPPNSQLMLAALQCIEQTEKHNGHIIDSNSERYPTLLNTIHQPPPLLYCKGNIDALHLPQLALVGSRHATYQGLSTTRLFAQHLANCGFTITSGLALGVDSAAHQAVINIAERGDHIGRTIAVMATGIDSIYPKQHGLMADHIIERGGALVSEFPPNTPPKAGHFPRRNRIISGLSLGVIVVEAAIKSGSLITAKYALEQNREVFAIPGSIHNPQSKGCHQLIKQGAHLVESSADIVEHLGGMISHFQHDLPPSTPIIRPALSQQEQLVLNHIGFSPAAVDQLIQSTHLSSADISECLLNLEINGWIKRSEWGYERV